MRKKVLILFICSLGLSAFVGIAIILLASFGEIERKVLTTTLLVFGYSIPGFCSSTIYEKEKLHAFSIIGMALALISCLYIICFVWEIFKFNIFDSIQWKLFCTLNLLCWSSGHISLMFLINNKNNIVSTVKNSTVLLSVIMDIMILIPLWNLLELFDFYYRLLCVLGILIALGTIGTPVLNKIYKNSELQKDNSSASENTLNNQDIEISDSGETIEDSANQNNHH